MTRAYNVVDADGHILEPLDLWDKYIDPEFRERRPRFVIDENGKELAAIKGRTKCLEVRWFFRTGDGNLRLVTSTFLGLRHFPKSLKPPLVL